MHGQIQTLRSEEYRVVNYTNVLINPDLYATPIADFLSLPGGNLQRSFTLSLKAKPKKKHNASSPPMDGGTTGQWSDDVRRAFIATRLAEARSGPEAPRCCDSWTGEFARTPVLKVRQSSPPRRQRHWFSEWAAQAPPPQRAENISFTHVINPFKGGQDMEHRHAQTTTLKSIAHAAALANALGTHVDVICVMYPEDVPHIDICRWRQQREPSGSSQWAPASGLQPSGSHLGIRLLASSHPLAPSSPLTLTLLFTSIACRQPGFTIVQMNISAVDVLPQFRHPVRLPFMNQILYAGWLHGKGKHLIYSNIDIGVQVRSGLAAAVSAERCFLTSPFASPQFRPNPKLTSSHLT